MPLHPPPRFRLSYGPVKFIYSEKAKKICVISIVDLPYVKSMLEISKNFVAFSEFMNFNKLENFGKKWHT